jgi:hypothetical protein
MYSQNETEEEIKSKISDVRNVFYSTHVKNFIFKNSQKIECAEQVSQNIDIDVLIKNTVFIFHDTNKIFFNYSLFKTYANPSIYVRMIKYILTLFDTCIQKYNKFQIHVDLNTFSISAAHRYKIAIEMFCSEFLSSTNKITVYEHLDKFYLYNTPSMIDNISMILSPFINDHVRSKIEYVLKRDSTIALEQFYNK